MEFKLWTVDAIIDYLGNQLIRNEDNDFVFTIEIFALILHQFPSFSLKHINAAFNGDAWTLISINLEKMASQMILHHGPINR